ncbi:palmitoyltransferase ZDHHC17 [Callorhinchus milii]|uniref:palmitoyltransferase ZDHHC17 n=1 Tax=Callorhinchus milii TaxID=7868 RepID=UPI0004574C6D|nr:palmitoyltransferase ZDHHC17 [Callorhinchus milii]|eukprot:gi/632970448/ref/XP_007901655.1/ PREDICTED: uncharacterized protein LOC103185108 [Callorhinchus milii]
MRDGLGQTLLHEAARIWHVDVASFLIKQGADVNHADTYGRTPLHVAAILNYTEFIEVLLNNNANIEAKTNEEEQTPFHYAARYDALRSLHCLYKHGANIQVEDYRKRTPLHLAALYGRSEAARLLLQLGCRAAVTDGTGESCLNMLVSRIPPVRQRARQRPCFGACILLLLKVFFIIPWTIFMTIIDWDKKYIYNFPQDWWRVLLIVLCIVQLLLFVEAEFVNLINVKTKHKVWKKNEKKKILKDKTYCHPSWPMEAAFVEKELSDLKNMKPQYYTDYWFIYACLIIILLLVVTAAHFADIIAGSNRVFSRLHLQVVAITLPVLWFWNIKNFRPFR